MKVDAANAKLLQLVEPQMLLNYALACGWSRVQNKRSEVAVLNAPATASRYTQIIVPLNRQIDDFSDRIADAVDRLAIQAGADSQSILLELLSPPADRLRFRLDEPATADGSVPLLNGLELLRAAERSLRSAGCSVSDPRKYHARMSDAKTELMVSHARLGQTEHGSFIAILIVPMDAVPPDIDQPILFREPMSFVRQSTVALMQAAAHIFTAVTTDVRMIEDPTADGVVVSANLCESILAMQPASAQGRLQISASWAKTLPPVPNAPSSVEFPQEVFPRLAEAAAKLRPPKPPEQSRYIGKIIALMGKQNNDGLMAGDVVIQFQEDEQLRRAKLHLEPSEYMIACDAHKEASYVSVEGTMNWKSRMHEIEPHLNFRER